MGQLLDYAPLPPGHRRKRVWRWVGAGVLAVAAACGWWWREPLWFQARMQYWEWCCATYQAPGDQIVYASDTATVRALSGDGQYTTYQRQTSPLVLRKAPAYFHQWSRLARTCLTRDWTPAVMHTMRNGRGESRLVVLAWGPSMQVTLVYKRDSMWGPAVKVRSGCQMSVSSLAYNSTGRLRVFAGQVDPADASRLTLRFELDGQTGLIDGRLDEQDRIMLQVHYPPGVQTASGESQQAGG